MLRSFLAILATAILLALGVIGCSTHRSKPALPAVTIRTATMDITPGIEVLTRVALPDGFVPSPDYPPMWLQAGQEIAVIGSQNGRTAVLGYGGIGYRTARVIAQDGGIGAPNGTLIDFAANPDGMVLALAVVKADPARLDVVTRDIISAGAASPVSSFDGDFDSASIGWLGDFTIGVALRARTIDEPPRDRLGIMPVPPPASGASSGLYTINVNGAVITGYLKLKCKMSRLSWSPDGIFAIGSGDANAPPVIVDRGKESCARLNAQAPIRALDWQHDSKAFLFEEFGGPQSTGAYRYDLENLRSRLVAISSGAAAFIGNNQVLALGSAGLTFPAARSAPDAPIRAEVALSDPNGSETEVESLGFNTTPAMLAASTMTYTRVTDAAAIATFSPTSSGPMRKLVIYSVAPKRTFLVAFGPARGGITMSWSPRGRYLAIADGDVTAAALTIMAPPH